jgi:superfamily II DNA or RNA helicase
MARGQRLAESNPEFAQRLASLTMDHARELLGPTGEALLKEVEGETLDEEQAYLTDGLFRVMIPQKRNDGKGSRRKVVVALRPDRRQPLGISLSCTACSDGCAHQALALRHLLTHKIELGLEVPTADQLVQIAPEPSEDELLTRAIADRKERARVESMEIRPLHPDSVWSDYIVTSKKSGRTYRVALRGMEPGDSYCNCPDFRANTLGLCKHLLRVQEHVKRVFTAEARAERFVPREIAVHLTYGERLDVRLLIPEGLPAELDAILEPYRGAAVTDLSRLVQTLAKIRVANVPVVIFPDAEEYLQQAFDRRRMEAITHTIRTEAENHPWRTELLASPLLPYQLEGAAFLACAGRAILADEMGLGKTVQALAAIEILFREIEISKVLIVCPASVKAQWRGEIHKFTPHEVQVVGGTAETRGEQYGQASFTICNYEQVLRDHAAISSHRWDVVLLDEGQRIKNWETRTSQAIKSLRSRFAFVLTGTPLENKLDDLYSIMQFIDDRRLSPAFRFFSHHRMLDQKGRFVGYRNLDELRERLAPVLLRRTRQQVRQQLPPCSVHHILIAPTPQQRQVHAKHLAQVSRIAKKPHLHELDLMLLRKELLYCRLAADSPELVDDQVVGESSKLDRLAEMFDEMFEGHFEKAIVFSEWTRMLDLIEPLLESRRLPFVRIDGSVPQRERSALITQFEDDPGTRLLLASNAAATGLNLQAATIVVNVDLPWNPAVLSQRIARAHRMGQEKPVQVYVLITEETFEERLLKTLEGKEQLARAALDESAEINEVWLTSSADSLRTEIQTLLEDEAVPTAGRPAEPLPFGTMVDSATSAQILAIRRRLQHYLERDAQGRWQLRIPLANENALDELATTFQQWVGEAVE